MEMKKRMVTEEALQEGSRSRLTKLALAKDGALQVEGEPHSVGQELWVTTPGIGDVLLVTRDGWLTREGVRRAHCAALDRSWLCSKTTQRYLPRFAGRMRANRDAHNRSEFEPSDTAAFIGELRRSHMRKVRKREIRQRDREACRRKKEALRRERAPRRKRARGSIFNLTEDDLIGIESPLETQDRLRARKQRIDARRTEVCLASAVLAAQVFRRALTHRGRVPDDLLDEASVDLGLAQTWLDSLQVPL